MNDQIDTAIDRILDGRPPTYHDDILWRAKHDPGSLTPEEFDYVVHHVGTTTSGVLDMMAEALVAWMPALTALAEVFNKLLRQIERPKDRRARVKREQIAEHRTRVAARVPSWKRAQ